MLGRKVGSAPVGADAQRRRGPLYGAVNDNLDLPSLVRTLTGLEYDHAVRPGAMFKTFLFSTSTGSSPAIWPNLGTARPAETDRRGRVPWSGVDPLAGGSAG
jgi:hypothetical protein